MALETNQKGYDVISAENERISVKTITSSQHVSVKGSTFDQVDRIMILRLNVDIEDGVSIECLEDVRAVEVETRFTKANGGFRFSPSTRVHTRPLENLRIVSTATFDDFEIRQYENGTMQVLRDGSVLTPAKPYLRDVARKLGIDLLFESGAEKNTRHLGANILKQLTR